MGDLKKQLLLFTKCIPLSMMDHVSHHSNAYAILKDPVTFLKAIYQKKKYWWHIIPPDGMLSIRDPL